MRCLFWNQPQICIFANARGQSLFVIMSAIIKKWSDKTYPGFEETKSFIESCGIIDFAGKVTVDSRNCICFDAPPEDMANLLNYPKFRFYYNLFPAGTDIVTAFCQLMVLRYRSQLGLSNESGTYLMRFNVWTRVLVHKNEAQWSQEVMVSYSVSGSREDYNTIVCL